MIEVSSDNVKREVVFRRGGSSVLEPVIRSSLLCFALFAAGCGDDGSSDQTESDAGHDAGYDAGSMFTSNSDARTEAESSETRATIVTSATTESNADNSFASETREGSAEAGTSKTDAVSGSSFAPDSGGQSSGARSSGNPSSGYEPDASTKSEPSTDTSDGGVEGTGTDAGVETFEPPPVVACSGADAGAFSAHAVATGYGHTCVAVEGGQVCCWGDNTNGQLGNGSTNSSVSPLRVPGLSDVSALSASSTGTCALTTSGEVYCWGQSPWDEESSFGLLPERVGALSGVVAIGSGSDHSCALTSDGEVYCWGLNYGGVLGNADLHSSKAPVQIEELAGITAISVTDMTDCALRSNGTVACWGSNIYGQLGNGSEVVPGEYYYDIAEIPVDVVEISEVVAIAGSREGNCALEANGSVWCWGVVPEFVTGSVHTTPVEMTGFGEVTSLSGSSGGFCLTRPDQTAACWGYNGAGSLGDGTLTSSATPVPVLGLTDVTQVVSSSSASHACALHSNGSVACWGLNANGQLGNGKVGLASSSTPLEVAGNTEFVGLSRGNNHGCGLTETGDVWCWGFSGDGEVGNGASWRPEPVPFRVPNIDDATAVSAGNGLTCILRESGEVACMGYNADGQVGDGTTEPRVVPANVPGLDGVVQVVTGAYNSVCALLDDGSVKCWGSNERAQLGSDPEIENGVQFSTVPLTMAGLSDVVQLSAGANSSCALTSAGTVQCWGWYIDQEQEYPYGLSVLPPTLVEDLEGVTALSAGWGVTCALKSDKTVACWGDGYYGQLGDEPPSNTLTVVPIAGLTDVAQVAVGWEHVCVRRENGTVACWGSNANGELGTGELIEAYDPYALPPQSTSPVEVVGLSNVTNLAAGGGHTCATVATGETYCWGRNGVGILGTGETESSTTPVEVVFP